jgi:hypothetical protein
MASVSWNLTHRTQAKSRLGLRSKIAIALVLILAMRIIAVQGIIAQQPAPDAAAREAVDGQNYKYMVPSEKYRKNRADEQKMRTQVRGVLNGAGSINDPAARLLFRDFYLSYLFPMMTTEEGLRTLGKERQDFLRDLANAKNQEAHRELVEITLPAMTKIVQDPAYRPQVRYNAMLIISSLNDVEPNAIGTTPTLPEPTKAALRVMLEQFQKADRDEIKIAALLGLSRHLEFDNYKQPPSTPMPPAGRAAIVKEMVALAEAKEPPPGRDPSVHLWMRRRAVEGLSMACLTKADADITASLERLLKDESESIPLRLAVATAFGRMSLQAPAKLDPVATAKELGYVALKATDAEVTRAEAHRKAELEHEARLAGTYSGDISLSGGPGGMPGIGRPGMSGDMPGGGLGTVRRPGPGGSSLDGAYGSGMPGGEMGMIDPSQQDPKHFEVEYVRRRLRQNLYAVQLGLLGNEDHAKSRATTAAKAPTTPPTTPTGTGDKKDSRGVFSIAKTDEEKKQIDQVYFAVRDLAESVETAGTTTEFTQLMKDVKRYAKSLEGVVGRRVVQPAATPVDGDEPVAPAGGKAKAKGAPVKGKAAPPVKAGGKAVSVPKRNVFGRPPMGK